MPDIVHRVGIGASPEAVFSALTTLEGLSHWWVVGTVGDPGLGGIINFGFMEAKVMDFEPRERVRWACVRGPEEWVGTTIAFQLKVKDGQTFVLFQHSGWREPVEFMYHCSTKWATFLLSLKHWLEGDEGRPAPYDVKIHVGD
jgi:uncharacterized protein YndB with AHSA1/START domain